MEKLTNKAYLLLSSLSEKELKKLNLSIKVNLNLNQQKLYEYLFKRIKADEGIEENEVLFIKIYKQKYIPSKDILIRNDYRVITKKIKNFLILQELEKEKENKDFDFIYINSLLERKQFALFEKEIKKNLDEIIDTEDFENYLRFFHLYSKYKLTIAPLAKDSFEQMLQLLIQKKSITQQSIYNYILTNDIFIKFCEVSISFYNKNITQQPITNNIDFSEIAPSPIILFQQNKLSGFTLDLDKRIELNEEKLKILATIRSSKINIPHETIATYTNLLASYSMQGKWEKSLEVSKKGYQLALKNPNLLNSMFLFNYISTCFRTMQIEKGCELIAKHQSDLTADNINKTRYLFYQSFYYIFNNDYDMAMKIFNPELGFDAIDKLVFKTIEIIVFFSRKEYELVKNTIQNMYQSIQYNKVAEDGFNEFISLMNELVDAELISSKTEKEKRKNDIQIKVDDLYNIISKNNANFLLGYIWLKYYLSKK